MFFGKFKTSVGIIYLLSDGTNLHALDFEKTSRYNKAKEDKNLKIFQDTILQLEEYLSGNRKKFDLKLLPEGTPFQKLAWKTLMKIPFGKIKSYKEQSIMMDNPKATRATGSANGKNPLPIIIPCHRIVTSSGMLGGYSGDIKLKKKLLEIEGHHFKGEKILLASHK